MILKARPILHSSSNELTSIASLTCPIQASASSVVPAQPAVKQSQILVVDDEKITRMRLCRLLSKHGYNVLDASGGREALRILQTKSVDLVVLDIFMPEMDGFRTIRMLRLMYDRSELPVVMMTSCEGREQVVAAFDSGCNDYIGKPIDEQVAVARIKNQLLVKEALLRVRESEERYALATRGTNDGMWDWNLVTGELYLSQRWLTMVNMESANWQPKGADWMELIHHEDKKRVLSDLESHLSGQTRHFESELRMRDGDDRYRWMLCRGLAVRDKSGQACRIAGSLTDITEGKVADALTGLPNRILFRDRVARCVEQFERYPQKMFAVIYMDVDDFKLINDHYGHDAGDEFLVSLAQRLESSLRKSDAVLARLGGDEFAILIENITSIEGAMRIAERLQEKMEAPFRIADREIFTRGSMGLAFSTAGCDSLSAELLLRQADAAMYHAKRQSDTKICVFREQMHEENAIRLELGGDLRVAIEHDELSLHFQPIVSVEDRSTVGFEALVRWEHPVHGNVPPGKFIPIAESNGLIVEIGTWVLRQACRQAMHWKNSLHKDVLMSVNVSICQLTSQSFVDVVREVLNETGLPPQLLKLEVTESLLMQNPDNTIELLNQLRTTGITIGIDDFGTGYSSLAYLHQMPLDILKIDRSFVSRMHESEKHIAIIRSIVALANSLQLAIVAEGVETADQLKQLGELGAQMVQGYYFSPPKSAAEAECLIEQVW